MGNEGIPDPGATFRHLKIHESDSRSGLLPLYEKSWAVVIGIKNYHNFPQLDHAVNDALGIAEVLVTHLNFPGENVFVAVDPKPDPADIPCISPGNIRGSTKAEIEDLLLNVIPEKAGTNDRVLVFYAGHGAERPVLGEPDRFGHFLIPSDAKPDKWNTYIDWDVIRSAGDEFCRAKHVFYILDACYSGIVNEVRDAGEPARDVCNALVHRARQALTAGTGSQVVADAGRGGHSPFTWHLINGLRGDALDFKQKKGELSISAPDLIDYLKHKVSEEPNVTQNPNGGSITGHCGGDFIFTSPFIAFSGQEHFRLGVGLVNLGLHFNEQMCFESAVRNLRDALTIKRAAHEEEAEVLEWLGRALFSAGSDEALPVLENAAQKRATAQLYHGIACAEHGDMEKACRSLTSFAASLPDHADAAWAGAYAQQIQKTGGGRGLALLVGVDTYANLPSGLQGCVNDVKLLEALLMEVYGFNPETIVTLTDEQATMANIIAELENLAAAARPQDTVVFLFSGHGGLIPTKEPLPAGDGRWYVLIPHDMQIAYNTWENTIVEPHLHALLTRIPARDKLFIASAGNICPDHDTSFDSGGYRFFAACQRGQPDQEKNYKGKSFGLLPYHLSRIVRELAGEKSPLNAGKIADLVEAAVKSDGDTQTARYFGKADAPLLPVLPGGTQPDFPDLHEFGDRDEYEVFDVPMLEMWQTRLEALGAISHPRAWLSLAHAWIDLGIEENATDCIEKALSQKGCDETQAHLLLCEAHVLAGQWDAALQDARALPWMVYPDKSTTRINTITRSLIEDMTRLSSPHRHALIVAIQDYPGAIGVTPKGPSADARAFQEVLTGHCGFAPEDIELLVDGEATREAILSRFENLVRHAGSEPALFYFAGLGTDLGPGPAIVTAGVSGEGKSPTILLEYLSQLTKNPETNLTAIFDAGWTKFNKATATTMASGRVFIPESERRDISRRLFGMNTVDRDPARIPQIGLMTIYPRSIRKIYESKPVPVEKSGDSGNEVHPGAKETRGILTTVLVDKLQDERHHYADSLVNAITSVEPCVKLQKENACMRLFDNVVVKERARKYLSVLTNRYLDETKDLLHRLTELRRDRDPESYLDLAITHLAFDEYEKARVAVEQCLTYRRQRSGGRPVMDPENPQEVSWPEAHYIHGWILHASGDYSAAESALSVALRQFSSLPGPSDVHETLMRNMNRARAHYWHGRAVQGLIGKDLRVAALADLEEYVRLGQPLGDPWALREFLEERTGTAGGKGTDGEGDAKKKGKT